MTQTIPAPDLICPSQEASKDAGLALAISVTTTSFLLNHALFSVPCTSCGLLHSAPPFLRELRVCPLQSNQKKTSVLAFLPFPDAPESCWSPGSIYLKIGWGIILERTKNGRSLLGQPIYNRSLLITVAEGILVSLDASWKYGRIWGGSTSA